MPIPIAQLKEAARPLEERILEFLAAAPEQAFSLVEILVAVGGYDAQVAPFLLALGQRTRGGSEAGAFTQALDVLRSSHRVLAAEHSGTTYYGHVGK